MTSGQPLKIVQRHTAHPVHMHNDFRATSCKYINQTFVHFDQEDFCMFYLGKVQKIFGQS